MNIIKSLSGILQKQSIPNSTNHADGKPPFPSAPFVIRADDVFMDMSLSTESVDKLRTKYFKGLYQGKSINQLVNTVYPMVKENIDVLPDSLKNYYISRGFELDYFLMLSAYIQTYTLAHMHENMSHRTRIGRGMYIMTARECDICSKYDNIKYSWAEIEAGLMPSLPLHWGCTCTIASWTR